MNASISGNINVSRGETEGSGPPPEIFKIMCKSFTAVQK
eukprot:SAG11_NODE_7229_length_1175_cov_0.953532_2_plen_38_part_01